jgi:hypothetical protein
MASISQRLRQVALAATMFAQVIAVGIRERTAQYRKFATISRVEMTKG